MCRSDPNASPWNLLLFVGIGLTAFTSYRRLFPGGQILVIEAILSVLLVAPVIFIQLKLGGVVQKSVFGLFHSSLPVLRGAAVALLVHVFILGTYMPTFAVHSICAGVATVSDERQLMTSCANEWNTQQCHDPHTLTTAPDNYNFNPHGTVSPVKEYMENHFFQNSGNIDELGGFPDFPTFPLVLLLTWTFIFLLVAFGPRVFAWTVSVIGLVSVVIMIGVLGYGWSMDFGRYRGASLDSPLSYFYYSNFSRMGQAGDWLYGLLKMTRVTKVSLGILPTMGKLIGKGRVNRNLSWLFVVLIYLVLSHLPVLTIAPYQYAATEAEGVPFTAYSLYYATVESTVVIFVNSGANPVASFFYFLAGYIHDVAEMALYVLVILDNFFDAFKGWTFASGSRRRVSWIIASAVLCVILFLLGLPYMTKGGTSLMQFFDLSTVALFPITWYCAGLGLLAIYVRRKTVALVERILIAVWVILVFLAWTVLTLCNAAQLWAFPTVLLDPIPRESRLKWFSIYWLTAIFPVLLIPIGIVVFLILSLIQRSKSNIATFQQPPSSNNEHHPLTGNDEKWNPGQNENVELVSRC